MAIKTCSNSSSSSLPKYDVFLSFRGEDTRTSFTDYLFRTLKRGGIDIFRDEEDLERGTDISPALLQAIRESRFAVVVLSENYSSSSWCLDELVEIVECKKELGLTVLPVFYHVEPTEVKNQTGNFGKAFAEASQRYTGKVNKWRDALMEVATISGWNVRNRPETEVIDEIAKVISKIINQFPSGSNDLVGMASRLKKIDLLLEIGLDDVRTIGIWGMGGVGKTTIAQEVYKISFNKFEAHAFVPNVREGIKKSSLLHLQKLLCKDLLGSEVDIKNVEVGKNVLKNRLHCRRVLIILDDVDELEQLECLVGNAEEQHDWLGPGSRVLVTTQDKHLLRTYGENCIYEVDKLTYDEGLQLFCQKAFKKTHPLNGFVRLSNDFVEYANGHPLALKIMGSSLFGRRAKAWSDTLEKMKDNPNQDIFRALRVTYDGLDEKEKKIFLDIACFFKGEDEHRVNKILESCEFNPYIGIEVLMDKSLVTKLGNKLWMHDLLQEFGRNIVRQESPEDPGERSRLWFHKDVYDVLVNNKGTKVVEGIFLSLSNNEELHLDVKLNLRMEKLRLLKLRNVHIPYCQVYLSNNIRLLEWHGYPQDSMPLDVPPHKLVELDMSSSRIKQMWMETTLPLEKLILINLSNCEYLNQSPDFSSVPNLERLILEGCQALSEVHPAIGDLEHLALLNLKDCKSLKRLSQGINLKSLKTLILSGCTKFNKFPEIRGNMDHLSQLYLDGTAIKELPISMQCLTGCLQIQQLPENLENLEQLEKLDACRTAIREAPSSILLLKNLKTLCFGHPSRYGSWKDLFHGILPVNFQLPNTFSGLSSLTSLNLSQCNIHALPDDIHHLSSLQCLDLSKNNLVSLPEAISQLSKLKLVRLNKCRKLQSLPKFPQSIQYVQAYGCPKLNDQSTIWASNNGFNFIDARKALKTRGTFHHLPLPEEFIPAIFDKLIEEIINDGMNFEICFPCTRIPKWISDKGISESSSTSIDVPRRDSRRTWMGFVLFVVFVFKEQKNFDEGWYLKETICNFSMGDYCLGRPVIESLKNFGVGSYGVCIYVPQTHRMCEKQLNYATKIKASVSTDRPDLKVKMCAMHVIYGNDVEKFAQHIVQEAKEHQQFSSLEHYKYLLNEARIGERSLDIRKPLQLNRYSFHTYECFTTSHLSCQVKRNLQILLSRIFFKGSSYARNQSMVFHFHVRAYISSWLFHQSLGCIVVCYIPRNLFDDKSWVGFCIYVGLKMNLSDLHNNNSDSEAHELLYVDLYSHGNTVSYIKTMSSLPIFLKSHQVVLFHAPRVHFREELNQCWAVSALSRNNIPQVEVEICGIRVIYEQDLENEAEVIIDLGLHGPDDERKQQLTQSLSEQVEGLLGKVECGKHKRRKEEIMSIHSSFSFEREYVHLQANKCLLSMAQMVEKQVFIAYQQFSIPSDPITLHSMNIPSDPSHQMNASVYSNIAFTHLQIMAETPVYTNDLEMWKSNLEDLLKQYCNSKVYITLSLRGHIISAWKPFIPSTTYNLCFPQKEILSWFKQHYHASSQRLVIKLPENLSTDINWRGLAVCVAFSVNSDHQTAIDEIEDSDSSFGVLCHFSTKEQTCLNSATSFCISKDKFKWLYIGGFIWLTYVPHWLLLGELNEKRSLEVSIYHECTGMKIQNLGAALLYQQDVEEFRQSIAQCMTLFFSNLNVIRLYIANENKDPSQEDCMKTVEGSKQENLTQLTLSEKTRLEFDRDTTYNLCLPPTNILEWFHHQSSGPSVTMQLASDGDTDGNWTGLVFCAYFSQLQHLTTFPDGFDLKVPHNLICHMETERAGMDLHHYQITNEEFKKFCGEEFIWLSYVPRPWDSYQLDHSTSIEASFASDRPGWLVLKCGVRLLYRHDEEEFKHKLHNRVVRESRFSPSTRKERKDTATSSQRTKDT
ncbi:disease resistance protein RPP2B-like [Ziziphus jujuba]|uniref:ADP-ribosyl cyclase/cyclic ADP-ribose hydrolase n=1 Tax=Ziziphus jujuba TaxID=326968 RepID=A0ABM3I1V6_ZIZJJ|nr:disease resistance protein RPP2B-like [Ziziphus jujuba]